jgi:hypothetical protein
VATPLAWATNIANHLKIVLGEQRDPAVGLIQSTPAERLGVQEEFYERYEDLVDVLVAAAQFGVKTSLEHRYDQLRTFMQNHYGEVQPFVVAYLKADPEDEHYGLTKFDTRTDAFQALWISESLVQFLSQDDANMIDRITRTREALSLYGEHLRYLVARSE